MKHLQVSTFMGKQSKQRYFSVVFVLLINTSQIGKPASQDNLLYFVEMSKTLL